MKHYTDTIPPTLAEKLKEKGMPVHIWRNMFDDSKGTDAKYCDVFDWFESKCIGIGIKHHWSGIVYQGYDWNICQFDKTITPYFGTTYGSWHEAAEKAIEKAITLI